MACLFGRGGEDGGAVLGADIVALAVEGGGIVDGEEDVQQVGVGDAGRVKGDPHNLGMTGATGADLLVAGVGGGAAGITRDDIRDADHLVENRFKAPEAAASKDGSLKGGGGSVFIHAVSLSLIGQF